MGLFANLVSSFFLGLLTPLTAVCVLPLYPSFLSFLSSQFSDTSRTRHYALLGSIVTLGVVTFMLLLGVVFTTFFQLSLTRVIGVVSPLAFGILALISLLLIFNVDFSSLLPKWSPRLSSGHPLRSAFVYGFFFGAIVLPCNPAFIGAFFARAFLEADPLGSLLNFLFFGMGLGFPLLFFSLVSVQWSSKIIDYLTRHKRIINIVSGIIMLGISLYYLLFVFSLFG